MQLKNKLNILSLFLCLVFFTAYSIQSVKLYQTHKTRGDLTNFAQAMWNSTQGRFMQNTFNYSVHDFWSQDKNLIIPDNSNIFGIHFNPILFLFIPLYKIFPSPITLLIIQSFLTAISGFIIFKLSQKILKNNFISLIWEISFLTYFVLISAVLSEFHAFTLSIFFGLLLIYSSKYSKNILFFLLLILFLFVQENTAISGFTFCLFLIIFKKTRIKGIIGSLISLVYFILVIYCIIPNLSNYHHYIFDSIYGCPLGNSLVEIIINGLKNPILLFKTIFTGQNITYLSKIYLPVSPFIFFSPSMFLVSLSGIASNLLSTDLRLKLIQMHYEALSIPFIFYGSILGTKNILNIFKKFRKIKILIICSFILILTTILFYKKFTSHKLNRKVLFINTYTQLDQKMDQLVSLIPPNTSVSTQDYLSGHLTNRQRLYLFPVYADKSDYIFVNINELTWPMDSKEQQNIIKKMIDSNKYKTEYIDDEFVLLKKEN